jgi:hypothetical protein
MLSNPEFKPYKLMTIKVLTITLLMNLMCISAQGENTLHNWTNIDGKTIEAKFIEMKHDAVAVEKDGKKFVIPISKLKPESIELAKNLNLSKDVNEPNRSQSDQDNESQTAYTNQKLQSIIIPRIDFEDTTIEDAINTLRLQSIENDTQEKDPNRKGVNITISKPNKSGKSDGGVLRVRELRLRDTSLGTALKYTCDQTNHRYKIQGRNVMLIPLQNYNSEIVTQTFNLTQEFIDMCKRSNQQDPLADKKIKKQNSVIEFLNSAGISFGEGTSAKISSRSLTVVNNLSELDKIEQLIEAISDEDNDKNDTDFEGAKEREVEFRWLQTDLKNADSVFSDFRSGEISNETYKTKFETQIKGGKIKEIAALKDKYASGEKFILKPKDNDLHMMIEGEIVMAESEDFADMRLCPEWYPNTTNSPALFRHNMGTTIPLNQWRLLSRWGDSKKDTLLLCYVRSSPVKEKIPYSPIIHPIIQIIFDTKILETTNENLKKTQDTKLENRSRAYVWLSENSKLLASSTVRCRSGQITSHENYWDDRNPPNTPLRPGVIFTCEAEIRYESSTNQSGNINQIDPFSKGNHFEDTDEIDPLEVNFIEEKLRRIVIPHIEFKDATAEEAIDLLRMRSAELDTLEPDPARKGVNFVIRRPRNSANHTTSLDTHRVRELQMSSVPLLAALKQICDQTKHRFKVDDFAVTLVPITESSEDIFSRTFTVPLGFASAIGDNIDAKLTARKPIIELLKASGIAFGDGTSATLSNSGVLFVTNTPTELDKIEELINSVENKNLGPKGNQNIRLQLDATYVPLGARKASDAKEFLHQSNDLQSGVPIFITAKDFSQEEKSAVVLVVTPWLDIIK